MTEKQISLTFTEDEVLALAHFLDRHEAAGGGFAHGPELDAVNAIGAAACEIEAADDIESKEKDA